MMTVRQAMTAAPLTIDPDATVDAARALMAERSIRHLPVVDDEGRLVGIIAERDVRSATVAPAIARYLSPQARRELRAASRHLEDLRVKDLMTREVVTIEADAPLGQAAALMFERGVGSVVVLENGSLGGILTERDAVRMLAIA